MKKNIKILIFASTFFIFLFSFFNLASAQQIQNGDKFWDGAIFYKATVYDRGAVELNGKDINGDDYTITLIWMEQE